MDFFMWGLFAGFLLTMVTKLYRAVNPEMSKPNHDIFDACCNLGLAFVVFWAIVRQWQ